MTIIHVPNGSGLCMINKIFGSPTKAVLCGLQAHTRSSITFHEEACTLSLQISFNSFSKFPPRITCIFRLKIKPDLWEKVTKIF
jgi:hypothetical protein